MSRTSAGGSLGEGDVTAPEAGAGGHVTVRYWASARAAQGRAEERVAVPAEGAALPDLLDQVTRGRDEKVARVLAVCSLLLDETAVHSDRVAGTVVRPGSVIDLLPPFAGG